MPRVSAAFFGFGVVSVVLGMLGGIYMGASENMTLMPVHAHLNLLGWVTMALYGTFYTLTQNTMSSRMAWTNFIVSALAVVILLPSLGLFLTHGNDQKYIPVMMVGEILTVLGMVIFGISVLRELTRKRALA